MKNKFNLIVAALGVLLILASVNFSAPCTAAGSIKKVKNTSIGSYEYVVFDYVLPPNPTYAVTTVSPPFIEDPSGDPVVVSGNKFKHIRFDNVEWMCTIQQVFSLPKTAIKGIKQTTQSEGVVTYVVGYRTASSYAGTYFYDVGNIRKVVVRIKK